MNYTDIIDKVSEELGLPRQLVDRTYKSYWRYIKNQIQELSLKDNISEDEFNKLSTNFNIPSLGKLYVTWDRLVGVKKRYKLIKQIREKNAKG
jgi:hypothetical protein